MGVPHKLKGNVVEFIIKQKQVSPSLSCRQLVDVVQQQFHLALSKSSINAILKSAALSSPVGRREGGGDGNNVAMKLMDILGVKAARDLQLDMKARP